MRRTGNRKSAGISRRIRLGRIQQIDIDELPGNEGEAARLVKVKSHRTFGHILSTH